jgi:hypothetical protein
VLSNIRGRRGIKVDIDGQKSKVDPLDETRLGAKAAATGRSTWESSLLEKVASHLNMQSVVTYLQRNLAPSMWYIV